MRADKYADRYLDDARGYTKQGRRMAMSYADDASDRMHRGAGQLQSTARAYADQARGYADQAGSRVAEHPLPYVLAAALLGFVFGRIFR